MNSSRIPFLIIRALSPPIFWLLSGPDTALAEPIDPSWNIV
jgi:hypothetical protein